MQPSPAKHPFDEWFERNYGHAPEKRDVMLQAWNAVVDAAMDSAVHMRDAFVIAGEYEYASIARDVAEMIGASKLPSRALRDGDPAA